MAGEIAAESQGVDRCGTVTKRGNPVIRTYPPPGTVASAHAISRAIWRKPLHVPPTDSNHSEVDAPIDGNQEVNQALNRKSRDPTPSQVGHARRVDAQPSRCNVHVRLTGDGKDGIGELTLERGNRILEHTTTCIRRACREASYHCQWCNPLRALIPSCRVARK